VEAVPLDRPRASGRPAQRAAKAPRRDRHRHPPLLLRRRCGKLRQTVRHDDESSHPFSHAPARPARPAGAVMSRSHCIRKPSSHRIERSRPWRATVDAPRKTSMPNPVEADLLEGVLVRLVIADIHRKVPADSPIISRTAIPCSARAPAIRCRRVTVLKRSPPSRRPRPESLAGRFDPPGVIVRQTSRVQHQTRAFRLDTIGPHLPAPRPTRRRRRGLLRNRWERMTNQLPSRAGPPIVLTDQTHRIARKRPGQLGESAGRKITASRVAPVAEIAGADPADAAAARPLSG